MPFAHLSNEQNNLINVPIYGNTVSPKFNLIKIQYKLIKIPLQQAHQS